MTKVFVTFLMLPKIGWAEPTRQKNPGAASIHIIYLYWEIFNLLKKEILNKKKEKP
jgi:hypothetical protein